MAMERYAAGDDAVFGVIYDLVAPALERYLGRKVRDAALREDIIQQTFLKMHVHRARFIRGAPVLPWAFAIAIRLLITRIRHDRLTRRFFVDTGGGDDEPPSTDPRPDELAEARQLMEQLDREIARLPAPQREAIDHKLAGMSIDESSQRANTTPAGTKGRLHKAYLNLRQKVPRDEARDEDRGER